MAIILNATTYKQEILQKYAIYVYFESQKVLSVCIFRIYSIEENIEADANLHHPPPSRNRVNMLLCVVY